MNESKTWYSAEIACLPEAEEAVGFALDEAGCIGTEINKLGKDQSQKKDICVIGYFDEEPDERRLGVQLLAAFRIFELDESLLLGVKCSKVEDRDWLAEWKKHWKPTEIGRFIIAPPWEEVPETNQIVIRIEPNMAFGTGTHDTTKLCLKAIGERYQAGQTVLDVGTGTGILAIATAKLGARTIVGCDTDEDSIKIARENAVLNGVDWIEFADGTLAADAPVYDFVCANLTVDVIVPILDLLLAKTGSILLLSGILVEQKTIISAALEESQISDFKFETSGEWISVMVDKEI